MKKNKTAFSSLPLILYYDPTHITKYMVKSYVPI